jgi:hypothetical protein
MKALTRQPATWQSSASGHAEVAEVVRKELAAQSEEDREPAGEEQAYRGEHQQRSAIPDHGSEQPA